MCPVHILKEQVDPRTAQVRKQKLDIAEDWTQTIIFISKLTTTLPSVQWDN